MDLKCTQSIGEWIQEFQADCGELSREQATDAFRAVLHAIRDRLPLEELAEFGSVLPAPVRGEYYGEWTPHARDFPPEFESDVKSRLATLGLNINPAHAIRAAWKVLARRVDHGNLEQVLHLFPAAVSDVKDLPYSISA